MGLSFAAKLAQSRSGLQVSACTDTAAMDARMAKFREGNIIFLSIAVAPFFLISNFEKDIESKVENTMTTILRQMNIE